MATADSDDAEALSAGQRGDQRRAESEDGQLHHAGEAPSHGEKPASCQYRGAPRSHSACDIASGTLDGATPSLW